MVLTGLLAGMFIVMDIWWLTFDGWTWWTPLNLAVIVPIQLAVSIPYFMLHDALFSFVWRAIRRMARPVR